MDLRFAVAPVMSHDAERLRRTARNLLARPPFADDAGPVTDVLRLTDVLRRVRAWVVGNQALAWSVVAVATGAAPRTPRPRRPDVLQPPGWTRPANTRPPERGRRPPAAPIADWWHNLTEQACSTPVGG